MVTLDERFNGAEAVGVAAVRRVAAESRQNALGDRLIVSLIERAAEEPLDGGAARSRWMGMEGGTEGEGILTLDDRDVVHGTTTTLNDIQSRARRLGQ